MPITETFDEACSALSAFLQREGQPSELLWICREDITGRRNALFVHPSPPANNRELYRRHFDFGVGQARGMRLFVSCFVGPQAHCYVWVPEDDVAADQAMVSEQALNYSFATAPDSRGGFEAQRVGTAARFAILRHWFRFLGESPRLEDIPTRGELRANDNTRNA